MGPTTPVGYASCYMSNWHFECHWNLGLVKLTGELGQPIMAARIVGRLLGTSSFDISTCVSTVAGSQAGTVFA